MDRNSKPRFPFFAGREKRSEETALPDRIIALGTGKEFDKYHRIFGGLDDRIAFCADTGSKTESYGHPVLRLKTVCDSAFADYPVVIFYSNQKEKDLYEGLLREVEASPDRVRTCQDWAADMLREGKLQISPRRVRIDCSTVCQLNCVDCYMRKNHSGTVGSGFLRFEDFQKLLVRNPFIREVELSNSGEPFLNPDMIRILEFAHETGVSVSFANGSNFNTLHDGVAEAIVKYGVKQIALSIDGATQSVYEKYRVNGDISRVFDNIKQVNKYKKQYKTDLPKLKWQYILMEHNEEDAFRAKILAKELGIEIFFKLDWAGTFSPEDPVKLEALTGLKAFNRTEHESKFGKSYMTNCHQMLDEPQINWDGRILGCCVVYQSDWGCNVFDDYDLVHTLNQDPYRRNVIALLTGREVDSNTPCARCRLYERVKENGPISL